jgi:hypothetical protein
MKYPDKLRKAPKSYENVEKLGNVENFEKLRKL